MPRPESISISLKRIEHPYLHNLFRTALLYDARKIKQILGVKLGGKLLNDWELVRSYEEILSYHPSPSFRDIKEKKVKADAVWMVKKRLDNGVLGHRLIIHEIKSGRCDLDEIVQRYSSCRFMPRVRYCFHRVLTTNAPLFVWCWPKYANIKTNKENQKLLKRGALRICRLDWLLDVLYNRLEEVFKWN